MNDTERQIVKWLRIGASKDESLALRTARLSNYTDAERLARSSEAKWAISTAIERGDHRDKQDG